MERFDADMERGVGQPLFREEGQEMITLPKDSTAIPIGTNDSIPVDLLLPRYEGNGVKKQRMTPLRIVLLLVICGVYIYGVMWLSSSHKMAIVATAISFAFLIFFLLFVMHTPGKLAQTIRSIVYSVPGIKALTRSRQSRMTFTIPETSDSSE